MTLILLAATIIQSAEPTIDDRIAAFVKGDAAARAELVKLGAYAIRPLQKARERDPGKVDELLLELKKGAAYPKTTAMPSKFRGASPSMADMEVGPGLEMSFLEAGVGLFLCPFKAGDLKATKVSIKDAATPLDAVSQLCRQTGLDWGLFHGRIVIAPADFLWPQGPPPKPRDLDAAARARATELIGKLGSETIDVRESASRELKALGPSVVPLLESAATGKDAEVTARCRALIQDLTAPPRLAFGPAGALRQKQEEGSPLLKQLREVRAVLDMQNQTMDGIFAYVSEFSGIPIFAKSSPSGRVTFRTSDGFLVDTLSLLLQAHGHDFAIDGKMVVVDTREAIEKRVTGAR